MDLTLIQIPFYPMNGHTVLDPIMVHDNSHFLQWVLLFSGEISPLDEIYLIGRVGVDGEIKLRLCFIGSLVV